MPVTFQDIFKSSFLERMDSISLFDMLLALIMAFLLGLFLFFIYKKSYSGVMYSASFGVTLLVMTLITTLLIMAVTSNVVLSLGMVGALSIVRFRTAVKDVYKRQTLYRMKHGEAITTKTLNTLCEILDCSVSEILEYQKDEG